MKTEAKVQNDHPFVRSPHKTLLSMSVPVLLSLVAEPLTGLVDTAFVARLGAESLAALGVGTVTLSGIFWIFNFLGIGTQTEVAQAYGRQEFNVAKEAGGSALVLSVLIGIVLVVVGLSFVPYVSRIMGASGAVYDLSTQYIQIRLFGAPAVLLTIAAFGIFRGMQDMRTPFWVAISINTLNIILDPLLIFGYGPFPRMGVFGAGLASTVSQWVGAGCLVWVVHKRIGIPNRIRHRNLIKLFKIGRDLFIRTGLLTAFYMITTRAATRIGSDAGAAHQAVRQVWVFSFLFLDAYATTGQSLVGYFIGPRLMEQTRRVARIVCLWSLLTGLVMGVILWLGQPIVIRFLVPPSAINLFIPAWAIAALIQPVNALAFATDGIHWGTGDFRYLRNAIITATSCGAIAIYLLDEARAGALTWIWLITAFWIIIRALFGVIRIWPGLGNSPLKRKRSGPNFE
ncbi:MAG: MATE family efflux transporter [Desulfobacterales bacterium]|nr:MATE family efflux transporter [Desulfobacterales bacterium]